MSSTKNIRPTERWLLVLLLTALVWIWFTWPLPKHLLSGIPCAGYSVERNPVRAMVAGDHLQLMYHFWLLGDMIRGDTPWFNNCYEFNTGADDASFRPHPFFIPFSLAYVAGERLAGRAFGWNLAGFLSLLFALHFLWRLARRFTDSDRVALAAAVPAFVIPYLWFSLMDGSPTGLGMVFVPMLLYGLDRAIRDNRVSGGILAGTAITMAYCTDLHVFYFLMLFLPVWALLCLFLKTDFSPRRLRHWWRLVGVLWPVALGAFVAFQMTVLTSGRLAGSDMAAGRALHEVAVFSPQAGGLLGFGGIGASQRIYVGFTFPLLLILGVALLFRWRREKPRITPREWVFLALMACGLALVMMLSLGPNGPWNGKLFTLCRSFIPKYTMIRQAPKIYCLMPSLAAVSMALVFGAVMNRVRHKKATGAILILAAIAAMTECGGRLRAGICELDMRQGAYEAVVKHAAGHQRIPRALVLPLWPGNSHWASLYEHYASLYRLRMVNGYSPVVATNYVNTVFRPLESANLGDLWEPQLARLRTMGVNYVLLHEDAFPEKVSPYPVLFTLNSLLSNPQMELLAHERQVWAFRILAPGEPAAAPAAPIPCPVLFPARQWQAETAVLGNGASAIPLHGAGGMAYACLPEAGASVTLRPTTIPAAPGQGLMLLVSGFGELRMDLLTNGLPARSTTQEIRSDGWAWRRIPFAPLDRSVSVAPRLTAIKPFINVDMAMLSGTPWRPLAAGESLVLPAAIFFHAGYTDPADGSVILSPDRDPDGVAFYGLNLPLERGDYEAELRFITAAPDGTTLGVLTATGKTVAGKPAAVRAGAAARLLFTVDGQLPVRLNLEYSREAMIRIQSWTLSRVK